MGGVRSETFDKIVNRFSEAIILPELLPSALDGLAHGCGAEIVSLNLSNGLQTLATVGSEAAGEVHKEFVRKWRAPELNSHRSRGLELLFRGWRGALTEQDCFTPQELLRDPFHQEFYVRNGLSSFAGIVLAKEPGASLSTSIIRRVDQEPYTRTEIAAINALALQLRAVGNLAIRIGISSARRTADSFAAVEQPVALIGHDCCALHLTPSFENFVGSHSITVKNRRLGSWHPEANRQFAAAIERSVKRDSNLQQPQKAVVLPRRNGLRPLIATIVPVVGAVHDVLHLVSAIVSLTDLEAAPAGPSTATMQDLFGMTSSEARLAHDIAVGKTLLEISTSRGTSKETLRNQLKSIFGKTGTARQADLALLLAKLPKSHERGVD